jgi:ribosomal protein S18 acetylase RimI-like enzyme
VSLTSLSTPRLAGVDWDGHASFFLMGQTRSMTEAITFEPFPPADLSEWIRETTIAYVDERVAGRDSRAEAEGNANASIERLFPNGLPAPSQLVGRLMLSNQVIGTLWIGWAQDDPQRWWVWDVVIDQESRGRGYGRQAMQLAESLARDERALTMGLNVAGRNQVARSLYSSLGHQETAVQVRKAL